MATDAIVLLYELLGKCLEFSFAWLIPSARANLIDHKAIKMEIFYEDNSIVFLILSQALKEKDYLFERKKKAIDVKQASERAKERGRKIDNFSSFFRNCKVCLFRLARSLVRWSRFSGKDS